MKNKKNKMMSHFKLFQSTSCPETNIAQLNPKAQQEVTMFYGALKSWSQVKDQVTMANPDLAEVLQSAHETLYENFGQEWLSQPAFVFPTNAPLDVVFKLLEFTESRTKSSEEKMMFLINSFRSISFPATLSDMQVLVEFSNLLDQNIGTMPLTLVYSAYNQCAMPIVGCREKRDQQPSSSPFSSLLPLHF